MSDNKENFISFKLLDEFSRFISEKTGLNFQDHRKNELVAGINAASMEFGFPDTEECIRWLLDSNASLSKKQIEILSAYLTVGETYFFREMEAFESIEKIILPQLLRAADYGPRTLRIWSAACSTGEEAYTIAMLLDQKKQWLKNWTISILATDINIKALKKAELGIYSEWSFRNIPDNYKQMYFIPLEKKMYEIKPEIRHMVHFDYLNLAEDNYPSLLNGTNGMDIIFCRNVLMYFLPKKANEVITKLHQSLVMGGWIIVAPTDSFHVLSFNCFRRDRTSTAVFAKVDNSCVSLPEKLSEDYTQTSPQTIISAERTTVRPPFVRSSPHVPPVKLSANVTNVTNITGNGNRSDRVNVENENPPGQTKNDTYLSDALKLYNQGAYTKALDLLSNVLNPGHPGYGMNCKPLAECSEVLNGINVVSEGIIRGNVYALTARTCANMGRLTEADQWCRKAIECDKLNPEYHYLNGLISLERGDENAAVRALKKCLYVDQDFVLAHFTLGNILYNMKNMRDSFRHLNAVLSLLSSYDNETNISVEEGITAGRLKEIARNLLEKESLND